MLSENEIRLQLQCALDDSQRSCRAEVSKDLLRGLAGLLHQLQARALLQSSPKGASTGTEDVRAWELTTISPKDEKPLVMLWKDEEVARMGHQCFKGSALKPLIYATSLSSPQEASKPQDCETCSGTGEIDETLGGEHFSNPPAECPDCDGVGEIHASQPSAASGRELPSAEDELCMLRAEDYDEMFGITATLRADRIAALEEMLGLKSHASSGKQAVPLAEIWQILDEVMFAAVENGANSISMPDAYVAVAHFVCYPHEYALTGAAPADANVGGGRL